MSGKLITIDPNGNVTTTVYSKSGTPDWQTLKTLVGGYIERVQVRWDTKLRDAYVNENGLSEGCIYNQKATWLTDGQFKGVEIVGPLVIWVPDPKKK